MSELVRKVLLFIASVSLAVSMTGMINSMLAGIKERSYEIGIKKVMGASAFDVYCEFIVKQFNNNGIAIAADTVKYIYDTFEGHTFYIQKTCNEAFSIVEGNECSLDIVKQAIMNIIIDKEPTYKEILSNISDKQKMVFYAIAKEGAATQVTSSSFIKKHNLPSASSVQSAMQKLIEKGVVTERNKEFIVVDRFLGLWIKDVLL